MATLDTDCAFTVLGFLGPHDKAAASQINSTFNAAGQTSLRVDGREISRLPYLNKLASKHPSERTVELTKRVIQEAIRNVSQNQHILEQEDWTELRAQKPQPSRLQFLKYFGYKPVNEPCISNLSLGQLNRAGELIETRLADLDLERTFTKIFEQIPANLRPELTGNLFQRAAAIRNWLATTPEELSLIIRLDLTNLNLTSLPPEIMRLTNLQQLILAENPLTHLPENLNLPQLTEMNLHQTRLTHLPENLHLPQLRSLNLANTRITHLRSENLNFPLLISINLSDTPLTHLPENLNFPQLRSLSLARTRITHFPENLNFPLLEWLRIENTQITHLPELLNFPLLTHLWLDDTSITHLPENLNLPLLEWLSLNNTPLTHLPENLNLPRLRHLGILNTPITHLPENIHFSLMPENDRSVLQGTLTTNRTNAFRKQAWASINQNRWQVGTILGATTAALCAGIYATQTT